MAMSGTGVRDRWPQHHPLSGKELLLVVATAMSTEVAELLSADWRCGEGGPLPLQKRGSYCWAPREDIPEEVACGRGLWKEHGRGHL